MKPLVAEVVRQQCLPQCIALNKIHIRSMKAMIFTRKKKNNSLLLITPNDDILIQCLNWILLKKRTVKDQCWTLEYFPQSYITRLDSVSLLLCDYPVNKCK